MERKITPVKFSIHNSDESPIFGESRVEVELCDEGAGLYFKIHDCVGTVSLELKDIGLINELVRKAEIEYEHVFSNKTKFSDGAK